jgi:hypothetical protein
MLDTGNGPAYLPTMALGLVLNAILSLQPSEGQMGSTSFGGATRSNVTRPASPQQKKRRGSLGRVGQQGGI